MTTIPTSTFNGVTVYKLSTGKTAPQWFDEALKKKTSLRYNKEYRSRIELLLDFTFPTASTIVKLSPDGRYIAVTGVYKPQIKIFDTEHLGLKFERHIDAEAVALQFLGDDYKKFAMLRCDRTLEIHTSHGLHKKVRFPKFGRDMTYNHANCDLYVVGASPHVYRLNLEQGRFLAPFKTEMSSINTCGMSPSQPLLCMGGDEGRFNHACRSCQSLLALATKHSLTHSLFLLSFLSRHC
jgi:ribosome biogenesis protein ENP2